MESTRADREVNWNSPRSVKHLWEAEWRIPGECEVALRRQFGTYYGKCRGSEQSVDF